MNEELIDYVAECTLAVVSTSEDDNLSELPTPPTTPIKSTHRKPPSSNRSTTTSSLHTSSSSLVPSLNTFIKLTSNRANAQAPTLLVTLVYLDRLRLRLKGAKAAKGMQCTYHRLFLACLMAAAKYCNDCCPRNVHWSKWSAIFTLNEVNLMEQELLMLLDYDLRADEKSLIEMCAPFFPTPSPSTTSTSTTAPMPPSSNSASSVVSSPSSKSSKFSLAGSSPSSYRSSYTSSTSASEALTPHSTVTPALITITSAPHHSPHCPLPSSSSSASKRARLDIGAGLLPVAVISRAKSWYGNLRNSS